MSLLKDKQILMQISFGFRLSLCFSFFLLLFHCLLSVFALPFLLDFFILFFLFSFFFPLVFSVSVSLITVTLSYFIISPIVYIYHNRPQKILCPYVVYSNIVYTISICVPNNFHFKFFTLFSAGNKPSIMPLSFSAINKMLAPREKN